MAASNVDSWVVILDDGTYDFVSGATVIELTLDGHDYVDSNGDTRYMNRQHYSRKIPLSELIEVYLKNKRGG